jgi:hypothetical protein
MILLLKQSQPGYTEFAPTMDDRTGILPCFPPVAGKPVHVSFDGGHPLPTLALSSSVRSGGIAGL